MRATGLSRALARLAPSEHREAAEPHGHPREEGAVTRDGEKVCHTSRGHNPGAPPDVIQTTP